MEPRDDVLDGPTYWVATPEIEIGVTINEKDGVPYEIFVQCDDPQVYQYLALATVFTTRLLRDGHPLDELAKEMQEIHCPLTGHYIPGTGEWSPSLIARIGRTLQKHMENKIGKSDTD